MHRPLLRLWLLLGLALALGCESDPPAADGLAQPAAPAAATHFDPAACGTITGAVTWVGPVPTVAPATQVTIRPDGSGLDMRPVRLANAPRVGRTTRGLDGAVVYLRGIDPAKARPWDLPPVAVEFRDSQLLVRQGDRLTARGFVRRGDSVTMQSAEPAFRLLRARGPEFFTLAFPQPGQPLSRPFDACGRVELTEASGCYWQAADLFVCDHPYYAVTDADGRFHFAQVPTGQYDLVAWHPNWEATRTERNVESGLPWRVTYAPPLESSRAVAVTAGRTTLANLNLPK